MNSSYSALRIYLFAAYFSGACESFCFGVDSEFLNYAQGAADTWESLDVLPAHSDVVLDYGKGGGRSGSVCRFHNILFFSPGETEVKSVVLRNFSNAKNGGGVCGILRSMRVGQKLKILRNITRELGKYEENFNLGAASFIPYVGISRMEIEVCGDVNVGRLRGNPLYKGSLSFGEWSGCLGNGDFGGPSRVLVRGDVNIFGLGELRCGMGVESGESRNGKILSRAEFEVLGEVNMVPFDASYPTWILNNRRAANGGKVFCTVAKIGSLNGSGLVKNDAKNALSTLVLDNPRGVIGVFKGRIQDDGSTGGDSKIRIVKEGEGAQYFEKPFGKKRFTGGLDVWDGEIYLNSTESIGNLSLNGGVVGALPFENAGAASPVLTVSDFNWIGGSVAAYLHRGGICSEIRICGDFKVRGDVSFVLVLKTYVLSEKYRLLRWNKKPDLNGARFLSNSLGNIFPVFEPKKDGLYVSFRRKKN